MDTLAVFKRSDLFREMNDSMLSMLARHVTVRTYAKGDILFIEGNTGTCFYLLSRGGVRLYKSSLEGREVTIRIIKPSEVFAEVVLFENRQFPVSAVAVSPVSALEIQRDFFLSLLETANFRNEFIRLLMRKQRILTERILYLTSYDVEERFFRFIIERYGRKGSYELDISKKEIASAIGTIPETLSRLIQRLRSEGIITWRGTVLHIQENALDGIAADEQVS